MESHEAAHLYILANTADGFFNEASHIDIRVFDELLLQEADL